MDDGAERSQASTESEAVSDLSELCALVGMGNVNQGMGTLTHRESH
jgi:hypothetical protein